MKYLFIKHDGYENIREHDLYILDLSGEELENVLKKSSRGDHVCHVPLEYVTNALKRDKEEKGRWIDPDNFQYTDDFWNDPGNFMTCSVSHPEEMPVCAASLPEIKEKLKTCPRFDYEDEWERYEMLVCRHCWAMGNYGVCEIHLRPESKEVVNARQDQV